VEVLKKKTSVTMLQTVKGKKKILVTGNPIFDENGQISYIVTNDRDITELDRLRSQLQETQELARGYASKLSELEFSGVDLSNMVVKSPESQRTMQVAIRCARADSTVLVLGESGVGKGLLAKLIHRNSDRAGGPFIRVDCPGIPEPLIESELFGYEKGAFTGARNEGKPGLFELANRGTLFLDEISEISLGMQSKLLRFLEDRESLRVGGTTPRQVDVRVVAATNRDIEELADRKQFRKDLYYRLNVVPIRILPLRERREDILPLILYFLEKFNTANHTLRSLSPDVIDALCSYDYPGNVRELANILERVVVVSERDRIEGDALPSEVRSQSVLSRDGARTPNEYCLREVIKRYEKSLLARALEHYGSQREAARALGVSQGTISRKIRKRDDARLHI
jgi:TyrR family helix-turn-helix protein